MALPLHDHHPSHRIGVTPHAARRRGSHPSPRPTLRVVPGGPEAALRRRQDAAVYRRRRVLAALVLATVLVGVLSAGRALEQDLLEPAPRPIAGAVPTGLPAAGADAGADPSATYVVQPGDTLWSIARSLQPEGDVRALVDRLAEAAGGTTLQPGQRLAVDGLVDGAPAG